MDKDEIKIILGGDQATVDEITSKLPENCRGSKTVKGFEHVPSKYLAVVEILCPNGNFEIPEGYKIYLVRDRKGFEVKIYCAEELRTPVLDLYQSRVDIDSYHK